MSNLDEVVTFPQLNKPAPNFNAKTTHGMKSLEDYKGKWLVLFSHPADFTPVCTTEFMGFATRAEQFAELNCELLGLSIDSVHSHIAWARSIEEKSNQVLVIQQLFVRLLLSILKVSYVQWFITL